MLNVQFLARYREELGCDSEQLPWQDQWQTIDDVRQFLAARDGVYILKTPHRVARNRSVFIARTYCRRGRARPIPYGNWRLSPMSIRVQTAPFDQAPN